MAPGKTSPAKRSPCLRAGAAEVLAAGLAAVAIGVVTDGSDDGEGLAAGVGGTASRCQQLLGDLAEAAGGVPLVAGDFALGELAGGVVRAGGAAAAGACGEGPGPAAGDGGGVVEEIGLQPLRDGRRQLSNGEQ